eukprot:UN24164
MTFETVLEEDDNSFKLQMILSDVLCHLKFIK